MSEINIYQRLDKVRQAVSYIQKDAKVQGYKAVTHDMVTSEARPALIENGIMIVPRQREGVTVDTGSVTSGGTPVIRYEAWYDIDFVNIQSPDDKVTVPIHAHALDHGDKAPGKCLSYATKYAILKLFSIETGESDESRQELKPKPITDTQLVGLREICEEFKLPVDATLSALAKKVYRLKKIEELPSEYFDDAANRLRKKGQDAQPTSH